MNTATLVTDARPATSIGAATLLHPQDWIETPTATKIMELLSYAQVTHDVVLLYGPGGAGKSEAATEYTVTRDGARYVAMSPATAGIVPALKAIGDVVGALPEKAAGAAALHEGIIRRVGPYGSTRFLIVDEAQCLSDAALDQLRAIHDAARIGIALIGSPALYSRLSGGDGAVMLDGLRNRIGRTLSLPGVTPDDAGAALDAWAIRDAKLRRSLMDASAKPGGMRNMVKALRFAGVLAERKNRTPGEADVRAALREFGG
ncbi:MAG: AAA family ATPase [Rhodanobacter sp.]|jgi:DNA transposition AAA+ family ATPase|nr:AAA family ATPase [Rhodanobacter sp.]